MRRTIVILSLFLLWAGCTKVNPVSPITDTLKSNGLQFTFAIPRTSYGIHDTLVATTTVYNPGEDTVEYFVFDCDPVGSWQVQDDTGKTRLSYQRGGTCEHGSDHTIVPHQSQQIGPCTFIIPIADLGDAQTAPGPYVLTANEYCGIFSLKFEVN